jgi:hypothetical protein
VTVDAAGRSDASCIQVARWEPLPGSSVQDARKDPAPSFHRYTVRDPAWGEGLADHLSAEASPPEGIACRFLENATAALTLPASLTGRFQVLIEGYGEDFEGPPIAKVALETRKGSSPVGELELPQSWGTYPAGTVQIPAGPKRLTVSFTNDRQEPDAGDRNLDFSAVILIEADEGDQSAPAVRIVYPPEGHEAYGVDAVVAEATDEALAWAELVLDGRDTGIRIERDGQPGPLVFPLLLRGVAPGRHSVAVRAWDPSGNSGLSPVRRISVRKGPPGEPGPYDRAVHLLNRFAYGPAPRDLAAVLTTGEEAWLRESLARPASDPGDASALGYLRALYDNEADPSQVAARDIHHAILTPNPARLRFVRWVDNHFSTWIRKTGSVNEARERETFHRLGAAPFPELLGASATSPTMLGYLDQQSSFARNLNENYAREVMELHTVGVDGGYGQADVTALASILTGWTFSDEGDGSSAGYELTRRVFRFDPSLNDGAPQRFIGMRIPQAGPASRFDRARLALEVLSAHPSTARFISRKLAEHYVQLPAPPGLVEDLSRVFLGTDGDLREVVLTLARHPAFRDPAPKEKVAAPFDYAVRLSRACGEPLPGQILDFLQRSGAGVYDRPTPDGYPEEDSAHAGANATLQRWKFSAENGWALASVVPGAWRSSVEIPTQEDRQDLLDLVSVRLMGRVLGERSNRAALDVLMSCTGGREELALLCASFVSQLPEASLR